MSTPILAHSRTEYKPEAPCPRCGTQVQFTSPPLVRCPACRWAVSLLPGESTELTWAFAGIDRGLNLAAFLAEIDRRAVPVAEPPPTVISHGPAAEHKAQVLPDENERPGDRLTRLADQFDLNGGEFRWDKATGLEASSQRRDDTNTPIKWYPLTEDAGGRWTCGCEAGKRDVCAHRAGYWRHLDTTLRDPDVTLTERRRANLTRIHAAIARQAGCVAPVAPAPPRDRAAILARADAAYADLFGSEAT